MDFPRYREACAVDGCGHLATAPGCVIAVRPGRDGTPGAKYCLACSEMRATGPGFVGSGERVIRSTRGLS